MPKNILDIKNLDILLEIRNWILEIILTKNIKI
jgi:hypothetical protein